MKNFLIVNLILFVSSYTFASQEFRNTERFMRAIAEGNIEIVQQCIQEGADVNSVVEHYVEGRWYRTTPLLIALEPLIAELPECFDPAVIISFTLHRFQYHGPLRQIVELLLRSGANANVPNPPFSIISLSPGSIASPLAIAIFHNDGDLIRLLLLYGATYDDRMMESMRSILGEDPESYLRREEQFQSGILYRLFLLSQIFPQEIVQTQFMPLLFRLGILGDDIYAQYYEQQRRQRKQSSKLQTVVKHLTQAFILSVMVSLHLSGFNDL